MAKQTTYKRDSAEVDKLVAEVDKLNKNGMSINKACAKVGLQNTVYYFRKRRDDAEVQAKRNSPALASLSGIDTSLHDRKDTDTLMKEYRELEQRMNQIKLAIAEKVMSNQLQKN